MLHHSKAIQIFDEVLHRIRPFTSFDGRAFAQVPTTHPDAHRTLAISSRAFREWFAAKSYMDCGLVPSNQTWSAIRRHLEAQACRDPDRLNIRIARRVDKRGPAIVPKKILIDLANPEGRYVAISADGWQISQGEGVHFETSASTRSLPTPAAPDPQQPPPLETLRHTLNLGPDWIRCFAWLLTALQPDGPYPILILRGPSGSGKSFAARILRALADPSTSPLLPLPPSARELLQLAHNNAILAFDHVSTLSPQQTDLLCRLSSGAGFACREDGHRDLAQLWLKRAILLTVTADFVPSPELAARALTVTLPELTAETRRHESELLAQIDRDYPQILGALYNAIATILAAPASHQRHPTRHAGALAWTLAAAPALNCTAAQIEDAFDPPPDPPPIVNALRTLLRQSPDWTGTATLLAQSLPACSNPQVLARELAKHALTIADAGISVEFHRVHGGTRMIHLIASPEFLEVRQVTTSQRVTEVKAIATSPSECVTSTPAEPPRKPKPPKPKRKPNRIKRKYT
jgi:putative DNA primase/helicase